MALDTTAVPKLPVENISGDPPQASTWESSVYWQQQQQLAQISRENSMPHSYARAAAVASKGVSLAAPTVADLALQLARDEVNAAGAAAAAGSTNGTNAVTPGKKPQANSKSFIEKREHLEDERQRHINEVIHHQFWTSLDCSGQGLFSISPKIIKYEFLQKLYLNHNQLTTLPECITKLNQLRILDLSGNQLRELPKEVGTMSSLRVLLLFDNQLRSLPCELGSLFQLQMLGLLGNPWIDQQSEARDTFTTGGTRGLIEYLRDNAPVGPPPQPREWVHLNTVTDPSNEISIMSYNTLCDVYATPQLYGFTPKWALQWEYRRQLLLQEVVGREMDIICLQEVNAASLEELWLPVLESRGYGLLFYQKTRARTVSQSSDAKFVDGCATFYRESKLRLIEKYPVEYNSKALLKDDLKKSEDIFNRVMSRDNIAIIGVFEMKSSGKRLLVANTHLHWDPAFRDVKLVQTALLLEETERMARQYAKMHYGSDIKKVPVLIAGDFNSAADSGVVHLFNHSSVPPDHEDMAGRTYGNFTEKGISHNLPLKSAYSDEMKLPFTNFTPDFVEVIDYIVYSTPSLKVNALLGMIDPEYAKHYAAFPNAHNPSDHIPIAVHFELI